MVGSAAAPASEESSKKGERVLRRTIDALFGYDFFISYSHGDGYNYPRQLKKRLEDSGFKVFLDLTDYVLGIDLQRETRRQVRKSRKIIIVGRASAYASPWVKREVDEAMSRGEPPIVINVNGALEKASRDHPLVQMITSNDWLRLDEIIDEPDGAPTDRAVSELIRSFSAVRQETKRQWFFGLSAAVLAVVAIVAVWQAIDAYQAKRVAEQQTEATRRKHVSLLASLSEVQTAAGNATLGGMLALEAVQSLSEDAAKYNSRQAAQAEAALYSALWATRELQHFEGHRDTIVDTAIDANAGVVATASVDGTARIWQLHDGSLGSTLVHENEVRSVEFSPDGRLLLTASWDGTARLWDVASGVEAARVEPKQGALISAKFSSDGSTFFTLGENGPLKIWQTCAAGVCTERASLPLAGKGQVARFSPDGRWLAVATTEATTLWDPKTGSKTSLLSDSRAWNFVLRFSPDSTLLASAGIGGELRVWNVSQLSLVWQISAHRSNIFDIAFDARGQRLVTASADQTVAVWMIGHITPLLRLYGHQDMVWRAGFAVDDRVIYSASDDGSLRMWDASTGTLSDSVTVGIPKTTYATLGIDKRRLLVANGSKAALVNLASPNHVPVLRSDGAKVNSMSFASDGSRLAVATEDGTARIFDVETGSELSLFKGHSNPVTSVAFDPTGAYIASASKDNMVKVWSAENGQLRSAIAIDQGEVGELSLSPGAERLLVVAYGAGDLAGKASLWDVDRAVKLNDFDGASMNWAGFDPKGLVLLTLPENGEPNLWRTSDGSKLGQLTADDEASSAVFSPDSARLLLVSFSGPRIVPLAGGSPAVTYPEDLSIGDAGAASSSFNADGSEFAFERNGRISFCSSLQHRPCDEWKRHGEAVLRVFFLSDSNRAIAAIHGRSIRLFDRKAMNERAEIRGHLDQDYSAPAFSIKTNRLAVRWPDNTVRIFPLYLTLPALTEVARKQFGSELTPDLRARYLGE
jgi:WD40 repeat protein